MLDRRSIARFLGSSLACFLLVGSLAGGAVLPARGGVQDTTEVHGVVSGVEGDRLRVDLSGSDVLPNDILMDWIRATLFKEVSWSDDPVQVEGSWLIVQVDPDSFTARLLPDTGDPSVQEGLDVTLELRFWQTQTKADYAEKIRSAEEAAPVASGNPMGAVVAARAYSGAGDLDSAERWYETAASDWRELAEIAPLGESMYADAARGWSEIKVLRGELEAAEEILSQAVERGEKSLRYNLGRVYERMGDRDRAIRWYREAAADGDETARARLEDLGVSGG